MATNGIAGIKLPKRARTLLLLFLIIVATGLANYPSLFNGFTNWDDPKLLLENDLIKDLSPSSLQGMFSGSYAGFGGYTPLVFVTYALEYHFFRLDPRVYHVDNLILHILNTISIFLLILLISDNIGASFITSLLFGIHPLHVEAIAWIQGRKDLLFSLFFLAATISYVRFLRLKSKKRFNYILSLAFFICALFSKVAAVSFPLVIVLLESHFGRKLDGKALKRAVPFLVLSVIFLGLAFITLSTGSSAVPTAKASPDVLRNLSLFFYPFVFYISKAFLPVRLMARYSTSFGHYPLDLALNVLAFSVACALIYIVYRRRKDVATFGIAFFVLSLLPTLPFHFAGQPYADRYMYLPLAGILFIVSELILGALPKERPFHHVLGKGVAVFFIFGVLFYGARSWTLCRVWHDSESLWSHVLKIDPHNTNALINRSMAYKSAKKIDAALGDLDVAARVDPQNPDIYVDRGILYSDSGNYEKALGEYARALSLNPRSAFAYFNRAILWGRLRDFRKSVIDLTVAIEIDDRFALAYYYRGLAFKELNVQGRALADFRAADRISSTPATRREIKLLTDPR